MITKILLNYTKPKLPQNQQLRQAVCCKCKLARRAMFI
ncbi:hypothetical protein PMAG_a1275 [Pseudoalteromonas mariniglutinosa NCIMB 1770]|nr:hypothetical protein [Pseudoalteromonas mariniglutinosa NCIMB 1770]